MNIFLLSQNQMRAIACGRLTEVLVGRREVTVGEVVNLQTENTEISVTATIFDVIFPAKNANLMILEIEVEKNESKIFSV